jgi:hypothetical protein
MEFTFHVESDTRIAELSNVGPLASNDEPMASNAGPLVSTVDDALDLLGNADYQGARRIVIHQSQLHPDFFELKSGLAGDILQKFSNYRMQLAIVGDFHNISSKSLRDFIYESNKQGRIFFVGTLQDALEKLSTTT